MSSQAPVLECRGLKKTYRSGPLEVPVLLGIDLTVMAGERLCIVGVSGSGKSTLLHLLGGLDAPTAGDVLVQGRPFAGLGEAEQGRVRNRALGFIYQFHHLLPEFSALDNVAMPLLIRRMPPSDARERAAHMLGEVGLGNRLTHTPGELSGGEQQRLALARALITQPQVLLADEPTGDLDGRTGALVFELVSRLHQEHQLTSVIATHNLAFARRCHRVLRLNRGTMEELVPESLPG